VQKKIDTKPLNTTAVCYGRAHESDAISDHYQSHGVSSYSDNVVSKKRSPITTMANPGVPTYCDDQQAKDKYMQFMDEL